jgi:predicted RNase H-like HicB family nuclease
VFTLDRVQRSGQQPMNAQQYRIETGREEDGRWPAEILELPGVMAYGATEQEATANAEAVAFRLIADRLEETKVGTSQVSFAHA